MISNRVTVYRFQNKNRAVDVLRTLSGHNGQLLPTSCPLDIFSPLPSRASPHPVPPVIYPGIGLAPGFNFLEKTARAM